ncbi:MAG: MucR family transcriptional regulator, partial [Acidobacteriota bacterium]
MADNPANSTFIELTAEIVSAYVGNNTVSANEIPALISQVYAALSRVSGGTPDIPPEPLKPAISVKKSIAPDYIVCLEDGKKFKSLKRHLRTQYNMTPEQYREKWGLGADYPMVAPNYAQ